ncbi:hypothetical protein QEV68_10660 [Trueperella pyogenes]|uniref:hypothetical protein n=1 Tax=Trueperella pyogenes TaxID=1661 RepID=UPI0032518DDA
MTTLDPRYDISATTLAKSDQLNADDLIGGPVTVSVVDAYVSGGEQPVEIHLAGYPGRPFKPSKSMRKVIEHAWGRDMRAYVGQWMTLYRDEKVKYAGQEVGGIKISHMSMIGEPIKLALTVTRGKKAPHIVQPLVVTEADVMTAPTLEALTALWPHADQNALKDAFTTRKTQLQTSQ